MKSVGIDVGSYSIKLVEIQTTNKGYVISHAVEKPLSMKTTHDQEIEVLETLKELIGQYDETTKICIAVPQEKIILRYRTFPFKDRIKISKSLAFELDEDIPFSTDNAVFDAKIVKTQGDTADVLACAVTKFQISSIIDKYRSIGCSPHILSAEALSLANVFEQWNESPPAEASAPSIIEDVQPILKKLKIILHLGHSKTLALAFHNDHLIGVRSILWGGKYVAEAISKKYELPFLEGKKEMELKGFILASKTNANFDAKIFSDTIAKSFRDLIRDLQLAFLEIRSENHGEITEVFLTGGLSGIRGLAPFFTQSLDLPVNLVGIYERFPTIVYDKNLYPEERMSVAIGLAIEGIKKPRNPAIQFLRGEFARQNNSLQKFVRYWTPTISFLGVTLVALLIYTTIRSTFTEDMESLAQQNLEEVSKKAAHIPAKQTTDRGITKYIKESKKRAADMKLLSNVISMNSALDVLKKVSGSVPGKQQITLDVRSVMIRDANVELQGYANSPKEIELLKNELKKASVDGKITSRDPQIPPVTDKTAFLITFKSDRNLNTAKE